MTASTRTSLRERPGAACLLRDTVATIEADIPGDMAIGEYRRSRPARRRRGRLRRR